MTNIRTSATVPPGTYVVGDPCYSIPDDKWMDWLEAADFTVADRNHVLFAEVDGHPCVGVSTAYGDGEYEGSDGNSYPVDAGLIGLVAIEVADKRSVDPRVEVTFDSPVECSFEDGVIHLGPILIDTDPDECCENCGSDDGVEDGVCWSCRDDEENTCCDCGEYGDDCVCYEDED